MNQFIFPDYSQARYQQMLQEAENHRLIKRVQGNKPGLLQRSGAFFSRLGQKLKVQAQANPATPALGQK